MKKARAATPIQPGRGQESVWDYPRPPKLEDCHRRIRVVVAGVTIAQSDRAKRVLETSHPQVYYIPPEDVGREILVPSDHRSWCEWKGEAHYWTLCVAGEWRKNAAWFYPEPAPQFFGLKDLVAFYPSKMDACYIDDEKVRAQAGDFYGGWITRDIVGPFKGPPGTMGW